MLNLHTKISIKIISLILCQIFLVTGLACPENGKLRSPMGFGKDGGLSKRAGEAGYATAGIPIENIRIIPQAGENWGFADLHAASYIENPTTDNLINKAKEYHQIGSREAKLLAGDFAIQALNKIAVEKISINVSELEPILRDFEDEAYDESGVIKNLTDFLSQNPDINKGNIPKLEEELENVNNMNERTELSVRFPKHQPGYDLMDPINKIMNHIGYLISLNSKRETKQFSRDEVELLLGVQDLLMNRVTVLFKLVQNRISARKEKTYDISLPTMSISEAAEWRRALHDMISNARDVSYRKVFDKDESLLHTYMNIWYLADFTLLPLVKGKPLVMDCNLKQTAERALENILWELGRDLPKDAVLMEFDKDIKDFGITADPTMIKEAFKILMQNSIQVAKERLEDENEDRKSRHLESLTLKDRPIQLKSFLTRDKNGAVSLQVIEMSDNVGGISDPLLLEETRPGNGRQKVTELNTSRRKKDTGFGLAYVWHIVSLHGGTFWIKNINDTPGKGIIASMRIPMRLPKDKETVSNSALASNHSFPKRELYPYFGLKSSVLAREEGLFWLKLRGANLTMSGEADLADILIELLQQKGNPELAINALRIVLDESIIRFSLKYKNNPEQTNTNMKHTLIKGLTLLVQGIYANSDKQIKGYSSKQIAFLAERFIRKFVEDNYGVDSSNNVNSPYLGNNYIDASDKFVALMIEDFLTWTVFDAETYRPMRQRQLTRRAILRVAAAGVVTVGGYLAYRWFDPTANTMERWHRLRDMPVNNKVSEDSRNQYILESKYFGSLKKKDNRNTLSEYDYNWLRGFLSNNRRNAVIFAARVFKLEPELLAGFALEEHFYGEQRNRLKQFLRELLAEKLAAHRDIERDSTVGLCQIKVSHVTDPGCLSFLKLEEKNLIKLLKPDDRKTLEEFLNYNVVDERKGSPSARLLEIEEINIFVAAFLIRQEAGAIVNDNIDTKDLPDMNPLSKHSAFWLLGESEYREIPTDEFKARYGRPFGGINYYHPLMRCFAVGQRYTGAGPKNFQRGMVKVKIYNMFLGSGLFKRAVDNKHDLPSRDMMVGL